MRAKTYKGKFSITVADVLVGSQVDKGGHRLGQPSVAGIVQQRECTRSAFVRVQSDIRQRRRLGGGGWAKIVNHRGDEKFQYRLTSAPNSKTQARMHDADSACTASHSRSSHAMPFCAIRIDATRPNLNFGHCSKNGIRPREPVLVAVDIEDMRGGGSGDRRRVRELRGERRGSGEGLRSQGQGRKLQRERLCRAGLARIARRSHRGRSRDRSKSWDGRWSQNWGWSLGQGSDKSRRCGSHERHRGDHRAARRHEAWRGLGGEGGWGGLRGVHEVGKLRHNGGYGYVWHSVRDGSIKERLE